jgi:hypothetical protein
VRYEGYDASAARPNVVIDGSPNAGTVLCLTHWPGIPRADDRLADDLSAQMAFRYLDSGMDLHGDAEIVTNNHFDQDGCVGVFALARPDLALAHRELLIDVAAAGDFATYETRRAARIAMVLARWAGQPDPFPWAFEHLPHLLEDIDAYRLLWEDEDAALTASEHAIETGDVVIEEDPELDLAVVHVAADVGPWSGTRFTTQRFDGVHPMALHNRTDMSSVALLHGRHLSLTHRYETWVQYVTRERPLRVALVPLARALTDRDRVRWHAEAVGALAPKLDHEGESSLDPEVFLDAVRTHLRTAPPAWDPRVGRQQAPA